MFWGLLILLSLLTFDVNDPSLNHVVSGKVVVNNRAGLFGAYLAGFLTDIFGFAAFIWPLVFGALGAGYVSVAFELLWWRWCGYFLLTLCLLTAGAAWNFGLGDVRGGGMVGKALFENTCLYFSPGGSALIWFFVLLIATQLSFDISWLTLVKRFWDYLKTNLNIHNIPRPNFPRLVLPHLSLPDFSALRVRLQKEKRAAVPPLPDVHMDPLPSARPYADDDPLPAAEIVVECRPSVGTPAVFLGEERAGSSEEAFPADAPALRNGSIKEVPPVQQASSPSSPSAGGATVKTGLINALRSVRPGSKKAQVPLPGLELLSPSRPQAKASREDMESKGKTLMACLGDFDIPGELMRVTPGPVVTMFEVRPAPGIRVSRIANLSDDLALALKAMAVRIQAPIPGSDTVGIEIPNEKRENVNFRELLEDEGFKKSGTPLTMALGKDISGHPVMADLSRMPHLLVAGATGAGKSVCLNSILLSFLYKTRPEDLQLLLMDPKRIELAVYADLPHLVHPVVTEMNQAKTALDWAVHEMDHRYEAMARLGVRNISGYNQKLESYGGQLPQELADLERLPYLVIIIDELADLMLTAAREVETSIVRLAQLARAAGIHMILATQRPSVDVVTGLIKANFPCRISFQVTSKHDSRTILDMVGAEHLLGKGDMLFKPSGGKLQRLHGPFVSDEEVVAVVGYWKRQLPASYKVDFAEWGNEVAAAGTSGAGGDASQDPLYGDVQSFVSEQGRASISLVQRRFKIGFNRAARLVEQLERDGIIGPADGSKPRPVVR